MEQTPSFDYIIVGAGPSAMGLLVSLLLETNAQICLIEEGDVVVESRLRDWGRHSQQPSSHSAVTFFPALVNPSTGRYLNVSVGRGLGGTSLINAGLVVPPAKDDIKCFDLPVEQSVQTLLELLKENKCLKRSYTGCHIPSSVLPKRPLDAASSTCAPCWFDAVVAVDDRGHRLSYYDMLLAPLFRDRPQLADKLTILTRCRAERLMFDDSAKVKICRGVEYHNHVTNHRVTITAGCEVIVCAGAIQSPALLLASGLSNPHIGRHLRDHVMVPRVFVNPTKWDGTTSENGVRALANLNLDDSATNKVQVTWIDSTSFGDVVPLLVASVVRWSPQSSYLHTTVEALLYLLVWYTPLYWILKYCVKVFGVFLVNAASEGSVVLVSKKRFPQRRSDYDLDIVLNYLSHPEDSRCLQEAFEASSQSFKEPGIEVYPGPLVRTWQGLLNTRRFQWFVSHQVVSYYHWMGTCRVSPTNEDGVVDAQLRVLGTRRLRVCDASVVFRLTCGPPTLTCSALGHALGRHLARERAENALATYSE